MGTTRKPSPGRPRKNEMFSEVRNHYLPERGMAELVVHKDIDGMFRWQVILPERDGKTGLHVKIEGRYPELDPAVAFRLAARAAENRSVH